MTGQPDEASVALFLVPVILMAMFFCCKEMLYPSKQVEKKAMSPADWDMITLGTIQPAVAAMAVQRPLVAKHPMYDDCVMALTSLGTKKALAKQITEEVLSKNDVKDLGEFITLAYAR